MKLTEAKIKTTKAVNKATKLFEGGGLYLYISPEGGKLWRWAYRVNRKEKTMSFGPYTLAPEKNWRSGNRGCS
ncbi:MAG TPA: Arm DNA-binding domain-containing protein [Acidobacteriaceae bacterium]|nr:Arm DNA-binding domain-containing protein [Acidobacteriaceae bacterium]